MVLTDSTNGFPAAAGAGTAATEVARAKTEDAY